MRSIVIATNVSFLTRSIYIDLESKLFNSTNDGFTTRVADNVGEACNLIESGFEYVTGEYNDGGKILRKRN